MSKKNIQNLLFIVLLFLLFPNYAAALERCLLCHEKTDIHKIEETGRRVSLYVDEKILQNSIHASKECTDCHSDIVEIPHKGVKKVNCRRCHYSGNPVGAPENISYDQYDNSVHGLEVAAGNPDAPVCQDCHGTHDIIQHTDETSMSNKSNIPKTCGRCHIEIFSTYNESVHGAALAGGNLDSPVCSSCHGEHNIKRPENPDSKVSLSHVSETCTECHGPMGVVNKYGVKTDRTKTFERSFHGIAEEMDNVTVANCASCHEYHDIRNSNDPKATTHKDNIPTTCGKPDCHPGATAKFAEGEIHVDPYNEDSGILYYMTNFFMILTVSTLIGLILFIMMDLFRRAKNARDKRH
jgi:hypothetical protein